jgi:transposase
VISPQIFRRFVVSDRTSIAQRNVIEEIKDKFGYIIQIILRSDNKEKLFKPVHKRWIVERTFSWFDNDRRLCRNYELLMENSENMVKLSAIKLLLNKI